MNSDTMIYSLSALQHTCGYMDANLPHPDAQDINGKFYRASKTQNPTGAQFLTAHESHRYPDAEPRLRRALSVLTNANDAEHQARLFRRWKRRFVIDARLQPHHGVFLRTPGRQPSHASWWPAANLDPEARAALFNPGYEVQL